MATNALQVVVSMCHFKLVTKNGNVLSSKKSDAYIHDITVILFDAIQRIIQALLFCMFS